MILINCFLNNMGRNDNSMKNEPKISSVRAIVWRQEALEVVYDSAASPPRLRALIESRVQHPGRPSLIASGSVICATFEYYFSKNILIIGDKPYLWRITFCILMRVEIFIAILINSGSLIIIRIIFLQV